MLISPSVEREESIFSEMAETPVRQESSHDQSNQYNNPKANTVLLIFNVSRFIFQKTFGEELENEMK